MKNTLIILSIICLHHAHSQKIELRYSFGNGIVKEAYPTSSSIYSERDYEEKGSFNDISVYYSIWNWFGISLKMASLENTFNTVKYVDDLIENDGFSGNTITAGNKVNYLKNKAYLAGIRFKIPHDYFGFYFSALAGKGLIESPERIVEIEPIPGQYSYFSYESGDILSISQPNIKSNLMMEFEIGLVSKIYKVLYFNISYSTFGGDYISNWRYHVIRKDGSLYRKNYVDNQPVTFEGNKLLFGLSIILDFNKK